MSLPAHFRDLPPQSSMEVAMRIGPDQAGDSFPVATRGRTTAAILILAGLAILALLALGSCRQTAAPEVANTLSLRLDAVPLLVKADSSAVSTIWATVLQDGQPVKDSTIVNFVAAMGKIAPTAYTRDGLATATFSPGTDAGVATIVAQVKAVRDTVAVTIY